MAESCLLDLEHVLPVGARRLRTLFSWSGNGPCCSRYGHEKTCLNVISQRDKLKETTQTVMRGFGSG